MNDPLHDKMFNWQADPPAGTWAMIARELEELNAEKKLARRITALEVSPPSQHWQAVREGLTAPISAPGSNKEKAKVVPIRPLAPYLFRYGAAALVIGVLAWFLVGSGEDQPGQKATASLVPVEPPAASPATSVVPPTPEPASPEAAPLNLSLSSATTGLITAPQKQESQAAEQRQPQHAFIRNGGDPQPESSRGSININMPRPPETPQRSLYVQSDDEGYVYIRHSNGERVRLSTKFAPVYYSLVSGASNTRTPLLQKLQQKFSRQPYTPDPHNLLDLLRLSDLLQQEF